MIFILCMLVGTREAVDENRQLKDAGDIVWYHDKDDTVPIASGSRMFSSQFAASLF
jgi:hypothetical protein